MEVVVPVQDFHFDSTNTTPYVSAPSSPKRFGDPFDYYNHYTSAPTSPSRVAAIYAHFSTTTTRRLSPSATSPAITFGWEDKPDAPKSASLDDDDDDDFEFDFSGQLEKGGLPPALTTADELFDKGKIRPLEPPPRLQHSVLNNRTSAASSPRSPVSPRPRARGLWSPRRRGGGGGGEDFDPFTAAMVEVTRDRGRERSPFSYSASRSRKGSRSLSPMRGGGGAGPGVLQKSPNSSPTPSTASTSKSGGSKKWRLRDLLLFRSASEGRATGNRNKDPLCKYTLLSPPLSTKRSMGGEEPRNSSFRSTDSHGSVRSGTAISAHEMHYTANRAASEELKKKTPLAYRQGLFGCLRLNPAVNRITRGLNSYSFNRKSS